MALALGSTAVTYHPNDGVSGGVEAYKASFGTDLGLSSKSLHGFSYSICALLRLVLTDHLVCWNILGLPLPVSVAA
jgi:hypothetical protein